MVGPQFAVRAWRFLASPLKPLPEHGGTCSDLEPCFPCKSTVSQREYGTLRVAPSADTDHVKPYSDTLSLPSPRKPHKDGRPAGEFGYRRTNFYYPPKVGNVISRCPMRRRLSSFPVGLPEGMRLFQEHMQRGKSENIKGKPRSRLAAQQLEEHGRMSTMLFLSDCSGAIGKMNPSWLTNN